MFRSRKSMFAVLVLFVMLFSIFSVSLAEDKTKVTIWHTFTKGQEEYLKKAVEDFNAQSKTAYVELLQQPRQGFSDAVYSGVNEGVGPDIIFSYPSDAAQYVESGKLVDLGEFIYDAEIGIKDFDSSLSKGLMEGEVKGFADGKIHYLPAYTSGPVFFYNETLFKELDLKAPTTWKELEEVCKVIKEKKGIPGVGLEGLPDLLQMLIMETEGAGYIDKENKKVLFDTKEVREKVQWLVDMVKAGYFSIKPTGQYFSEDFNAGSVASFIGSNAGAPYIKPDGFEFNMAPVPVTKWYPSWNRGPIAFSYNDEKRAEATYEFIKYFISAEVNAGWAEATKCIAPYAWTKEVEAYKAYLASDSIDVKALSAVAAKLDIVGSLPNIAGARKVRSYLQAALEKAAGGTMTVDEAWTECVTLSNAALQGK